MRIQIVTPSIVMPMSVEDGRRQIRETEDIHDERLRDYILAAVDVLESATNNRFMPQVWDVYYRCYEELAAIPIGPILSVDSVNYTDEDGVEAALATTVWGSFTTVRPPFSACLYLKANQAWPTTTLRTVYPIRVRVTAGWAQEIDADDVDAAESGTTTTNIKMTAHGLVTGDIIYNSTRGVQRTVTRVDADNVTVEAVTGQTTADAIRKFQASAIPQSFQQGLRQLVGKYFELTDDELITPAGSSLQELVSSTAEKLAKRYALTQVL